MRIFSLEFKFKWIRLLFKISNEYAESWAEGFVVMADLLL